MKPRIPRRSFALPVALIATGLFVTGPVPGQQAPEVHGRFISIDNVCAWPNLTLLKDGTLTATIFNQPSHGRVEGDVETWISTDGGVLWERGGVAAIHDPGTNRLNVAAGRAHDGSLVVLSTGTSNMEPRGGSATDGFWDWLPILVSRSSDRGRTWQRSSSVELPAGVDYMIPFGDVITGPGKTLAACAYHDGRYKGTGNPSRNRRDPTARAVGSSYLLFSKDDGRTWGDAVVIGADDYNETVVLRLRPDRWLAAARTIKDAHLELFVSKDEGRSWAAAGPLTLPRQHPGHLLRLKDGRIVLTYGVRDPGHSAVGMRWSDDEGRTWKPATTLVHLEGSTDHGYPSTVELADGALVTAYYSNGIPEHRRYHMGVVRWSLPK